MAFFINWEKFEKWFLPADMAYIELQCWIIYNIHSHFTSIFFLICRWVDLWENIKKVLPWQLNVPVWRTEWLKKSTQERQGNSCIQKFRCTKIQMYRNSDIWKFKCTKTQINKNSDLQKFRSAKIQIYKNSDVQKFRYTKIQIYKNSDLQKFRWH